MQLPLFAHQDSATDDWTFNGVNTRTLTHCYHDYPARMIPQVAAKLIDRFAPTPGVLFDPYCGTGTTLVEGILRGHEVHGTDLNPLARLISRAKVTPISLAAIDHACADLGRWLELPLHTPELLPNGIDLTFWFKPQVIAQLAHLKVWLQSLQDLATRQFFEVAFSETVRESSNTRLGEFKLYRLPPEKLASYGPPVFGIFRRKIQRNRQGLAQFMACLEAAPRQTKARLYAFNTVEGIPSDTLTADSVDIVITSPPYGDSRTTVAYGQYSRLSAEWLGLGQAAQVDSLLMGGRSVATAGKFDAVPLDAALEAIATQHPKRATEVIAFYADLRASINNIAPLVKRGGYACYVVGNRKVKGVLLPTDQAIQAFFESHHFQHHATYYRAIPNKRMPSRNSPSNVAGATDSTMNQEIIVVMQRR